MFIDNVLNVSFETPERERERERYELVIFFFLGGRGIIHRLFIVSLDRCFANLLRVEKNTLIHGKKCEALRS